MVERVDKLTGAPLCTAKAKSTGKLCGMRAIRGATKCAKHGGRRGITVPANRLNAGAIYSQYMSKADLDNYASGLDAIGKLDHEIAMIRVQVARVLRTMQKAVDDWLAIDSIADGPGGLTVTKKIIDYDIKIVRYTKQIETLETSRAALIASASGADRTLTIVGGLPVSAMMADDDTGVTVSGFDG